MSEEMKVFKCHKLVHAKPMTRADYNKLRGWPLPADEDGNDEGYLVEYIDGGERNHADFKGYISWSPKSVFENGYRDVTTHQDRVRIEQADLMENAGKLEKFLGTETFEKLDPEEKDDMTNQLVWMSNLAHVLGRRIARFK